MEKKTYKSKNISVHFENNSVIIIKKTNKISISLQEAIGLIVILQELIREHASQFRK